MIVTPAMLEAAAGRPLANTVDRPLADAMNKHFPRYQINTPLRVAHFLAQAAHESAHFTRFVERGNGDGPDADPWDDYLERYDGRADLGNTVPGDGERYRGRGIFQLTGRANYRRLGRLLGLNLEGDPKLALVPENAVLIACVYWTGARLNPRADRDDVRGITKAINGGYNGLPDRIACLGRAKQAVGL